MQPAEVLVKATGLSLGYAQRTVLHDINLEVQSGEFWFCLGLKALVPFDVESFYAPDLSGFLY
jgi:hypothetical protein